MLSVRHTFTVYLKIWHLLTVRRQDGAPGGFVPDQFLCASQGLVWPKRGFCIEHDLTVNFQTANENILHYGGTSLLYQMGLLI